MKLQKVLLTALSFALVAAIAVGGTLAYLTDRDSKVNVFTVGDVAIELNEEFVQGSELIPGVRIEKEATITNTGDNDAWVWMTVAVPAVLDDEDAELGAANVLHWNMPGCFWYGYHDQDRFIQSGIKDGYLPEDSTGVADEDSWINDNVAAKQTIDNIEYNVYTFKYVGAIVPGETTNIGLSKVFLDENLDIAPDGQWYIVENGNATKINWNSNTDGNPLVYVNAYAIQKDQFDSVEAAYKAYNTQWADNGTEYADPNDVPVGYQVNNSEEFAEAVAAGETVIWLNDGTYVAPAAAKGKTLTIGGTENAVLEIVPAGQGEANGQLDYSFDGSTVTFNGITIKTNSTLYAGYARLSGTYNNCVIQNTYNLGTGNSAFYNCELNISNDYLRVGGASTAIFDGCTFNTDGRAILVFQDGTSVTQTVTVKDCTFNATAAANTWDGIHVAAVSYDGSQGGTYVVNFEGTNTVDSDFNGLWQIKNGEANVTVNGLN